MRDAIIPMPGNETTARELEKLLDMDVLDATVSRSSDGESYVRVAAPLYGRAALVICTLDRPDDRLVPLMLLSSAIRDRGALSVGLVAPYHGYLGRDRVLNKGGTTCAQHVAHWLSREVDWVVTADPTLHLHRTAELSHFYSVPIRVAHVAADVGNWIRDHVSQPLLIGPDAPSTPWIASVAKAAQAPYAVLDAIPRGMHDVEVTLQGVERWRSHTPVLIDETASTDDLMIQALRYLGHAGLRTPLCLVLHAIFGQAVYRNLRAAGAGEVVSSNTVVHPTNVIDLTPALAAAVKESISKWRNVHPEITGAIARSRQTGSPPTRYGGPSPDAPIGPPLCDVTGSKTFAEDERP